MRHLILAAGAAALLSTSALAHHAGERFYAGDVAVSHAYTFENTETAHAMRVYVTLDNSGDEADRLLSGSVPFADDVKLEGQVLDASGSLETTELDGITVKAGQTLTMQPGAVWIELESVHRTFEHGEHFDMQLTFEKAGAVTIEVEVEEVDDHAHEGEPEA